MSREKDLLTKLLESLPSFDYFGQSFHPSLQNWLPFYWQGWSQTTRYTYVLDHLEDLDAIWSGMRENIRSDIRKASRRLEIVEGTDVDQVANLQAMTFARQGKRYPEWNATLKRIEAACNERAAGRTYIALDSDGRKHAAIYVVWDERSAFYLLGGADPNLRNSGAHSLLMWKAIQFCGSVTKSFDFEGSMIPGVERFFRAFGAKQVPYNRLTRANSKLVRAALAYRQLRAA